MVKTYGLIHEKRARGKEKKKNHVYHNSSAQKSISSGRQAVNFSFDTIHGMKLKEVEYKIPSREERKARRSEFQGSKNKEGMRSKFLKMLAAEHAQELKDLLGMTDADIALMAEGKSVNGYNVHHKLPIHGGGKNEFSNFILTPLYPHDQWHHDVIDPQICNLSAKGGKILLPWTDAMIYDPKQYGFTKNNKKVKPNYVSRVNPEKYPKIYKPEHIADANLRKRELEKFSSQQKNVNRKLVSTVVSQRLSSTR